MQNPIRCGAANALEVPRIAASVVALLCLFCAGSGFANEAEGEDSELAPQAARSWERAPYPYFDEGQSLTPTRSQRVASPTWQELSAGLFSGKGSRRGSFARWSVSEAYVRFGLDLEERVANDTGSWIKTTLGGNLPLAFGEIGLSGGLGFRDDDVVRGLQTGFHARVDVAIWPVSPIGFAGFVDYGVYGRGEGDAMQWGIEGRVQVWRALSIGIGWRETIGEGGSTALDMSGFTLSLTLSFSSFSGMWQPRRADD